MRFTDLLNEQAKAEDLQQIEGYGIGAEEADDFLEKTYWDSPEPAQIQAGQASFNEPEKAEALAKSVTTAKDSGQAGGIGVVPAIFAGLAGAFSDDGVATTSKLLEQWDPRTQEAKRVKREGEAGKIAGEATARQRDLDMNDPDSDISKRSREFLATNVPDAKVEGMAASDIKRLMPDLWNAAGLEQKGEYNKAMLQQSADKVTAAQLKADALAKAKVTAKETDVEARATAADTKVKADTRKQHNKLLLDEYGVLGTSARKYDQTMRDVDRIIELGGKVETGPIMGSAPAVAIRKMLPGGDELQELESLVKGLPLPVLKATFGAAFSVKEGETLAQSLANVNMDEATFMNRMTALKDNVQFEKDEYDAQTSFMKDNDGSLIGYTPTAVMGGQDDMVSVRSPDGKTGKIPRANLQKALQSGYTEI